MKVEMNLDIIFEIYEYIEYIVKEEKCFYLFKI